MTKPRIDAALAQVRAVQKNPGFVALSALIGHRHKSGRSENAYRILRDLGAAPDVAHEILEGWIDESRARLTEAGVSVELEAAVRLASFIPGAAKIDFLPALIRAGGISEVPPQGPGPVLPKRGA